MHFDVPHALLPLDGDHALRFRAAAGTRMRVLSGTAWLTVDHEPNDRVLAAGAEWALPGGVPMTLSALGGPALLDLCDAVADTAPAAPLRPRPPAAGERAPGMALHCAGLA